MALTKIYSHFKFQTILLQRMFGNMKNKEQSVFVHPRQYDSAVYRDLKEGGGVNGKEKEGPEKWGGGQKKPERLGKKRCKKIPDSPH